MIFTGQMTKPTVSKTTWNSMYGQLAEQKYVGGKSESQTGNSSRIHFTSEAMKKLCKITKKYQLFTVSPPIRLRLYTSPYWSNPPFLIFDIQALWCSGVSARVPECLQYDARPFKQQQFGTADIEGDKVAQATSTAGNDKSNTNRHKKLRENVSLQ